MRSSSSRLRAGAAVASTTLALVFTLGTPAFGGERGAGKDRDRTSEATVTEDNDTNDGGTPNNVADDGDNRHPSGKDRSVESGGSGNQGKSTSDPDGDSNGGADKPGGSGGEDLADQDGNNGCGNDDDFEDDNNGNCGGPDRTRVQSEARERECVHASEMGRRHGQGKGAEGEPCDDTRAADDKDRDADKGDDDVCEADDLADDMTDGCDDDAGAGDDGDAAGDTDTNTGGTDGTGGGTGGTGGDTAVDGTDTATGAVLGSQLENAVPTEVLAAELENNRAMETKVLGVSIERGAPGETAGTGAAVLGTTFTRGAVSLARTGFGMTLIALAGLALVLFGFGLKRYGRRSTV